MSYHYQRRTLAQLRKTANNILARFPHRRNGLVLDVEGLLEDLGLEIIFRPTLGIPASAYVARDRRYVVVNQLALSYLPRFRFTIAEEICHRVLEYQLWTGDALPEGAAAHELTSKQHRDIETDARALAAEILTPEPEFRARFSHHRSALSQENSGREPDQLLKHAVRITGEEFGVSVMSASIRAWKIGLITREELHRVFPPLM